ncbi:MAG TPA: cytochrome c [Chthoniobacteraceae bacterium]|nr:cytochrome c [Chthoniobacteraceae bacterium]
MRTICPSAVIALSLLGGLPVATAVYSQSASDTPRPAAVQPSAPPAAADNPESPVERGRKFYLSNCAVCHQPSGLGIPNQYPPLAGSSFVNGSPKRLAMIILHGLQGPLTVGEHKFNGAQPAWGKALDDRRIAEVLTYIRQAWGNKGGPVTEKQIASVREEFKGRDEPWSSQDILAVPDTAVPPGGEQATPTPQR